MLKLLLAVAFLANVALIVTAKDTQDTQSFQETRKSFSSSSSSSSSESSSSNYEESSTTDDGNAETVTDYKAANNSESSSSSSDSYTEDTYTKSDSGNTFNDFGTSSGTDDGASTYVPNPPPPKPPKCGKNEEPSDCINGGCYSARTCADLDRLNGSTICVRPRKCEAGCLCKPGYLRDRRGVCILETACPNSKCKNANETYVQCKSDCDVQSCDQVGYGPICPISDNPRTCQPGCICRDGMVKDSNGVCIPKEQCPTCKGDPNARPGCGVNCGRLCSNYNKGPVACIEICYENACDCKEGFVFDENTSKCVETSQCTQTCGVNEVFDGCANGGCYSARTCKDLRTNNGTFLCVDVIECKPGCLCKPGYLRNDKGVCVPEFKCPGSICKKANETFVQCVSECTVERCDQVGYGSLCPNGETSPCQAKCICIDGYARDAKGNCIPKDQCPTCGGDPHSKPGCGVNCGRRCSNYNKGPVACIKICYDNACDCEEGYFYDDNLKKCVKPKECTPTCGADEEFNSCANSGCNRAKTCKDLDTLNGTTSCVDVVKKCKPGCLCKEGLLRDDEGKCIPENTCPNSKCKNGNETYVSCPAGNCSPKRCDQLGFPVPCADQGRDGKCPGGPGCVCRNGFVKDQNNVCVPINECPSCGGDENAKSGCGGYCGSRCTDIGKGPTACILSCRLNGCDCKEGFYYDSKVKKCVYPSQCSENSCGKNQIIDGCANGGCYSARTCDDLDRLNGGTICVDPIKCIPGCLCAPGFLKAKNGTCIPENECPNTKCKNPNETYKNCASKCDLERCDQLGYGSVCPARTKPSPCRAKCVCRDGYLKNAKGVCVPRELCPSCRGDPNAEPGCGINCNQRCSTYGQKPKPCPLACVFNSCNCKKGYVYDDNTKKCVKPSECTATCGQNEEYSTCTNGGCFGARNCTEIGASIKCVKIDPKYCKKGCICSKGYVKNKNGVCIAEDQCTNEDKCSGQNQFYDLCPPKCSPQTCASIDAPPPFCPVQPAVCQPACRCAQGYFTNANGVCIKKKDCPKTCPKNEEWNNCVNGGCYGARNCSEIGAPVKCVNLIEGACKGGCVCSKGFLRDDKGECVPVDQCPGKCKKNEVYDRCPGPCPSRTCGFDDRLALCAPGPKEGDPKCPPPVCRCKDGLYRNDKGECVTWENCPTCNGENEVYNPCPNPCPPQRCDVDPRVIRCAAPPKLGDPNCAAGCVCKDGFVRDNNGKCVLRENCPKCTKPNEEYVSCPDDCPPNTCESIGKRYNCPLKIPGKNCAPAGCRCKKGHSRNKLGECISNENCLKCSKPNEYYSCGGACDNVCDTLSQQNQTSCPIINIKCNEMCYCDKDYARNSSGICIPIKDCPKCPGNAIYNTCPAQKCDAEYCPKSRNDPQACRSTKNCGKPRCTCGFNQKRDRKTNNCIAIRDCPPFPCDGPNERYVPCPPVCPGETCKDFINNSTCPKYRIGIVVPCQPQCKCKKGYFRDANNICVKSSQCLKVKPVPTDAPSTPAPSTSGGNALEQLKRGINIFNFKLLPQLIASNPGKNIIYSGFSAQLPFAQLAMNANGQCEKELLSAINLSSKDEIPDAYKTYLESWKSGNGVNFAKALNMYINNQYPVQPSFITTNKDVFNATTKNMNFNTPKEAAKEINDAVAAATNDLIKDLIPESVITPNLVTLIVNAIYFKGTWKVQFDKKNTQDRDFYPDSKTTVQVPTMFMNKVKLNYTNDQTLDAQVVDMYFENPDYKMRVVLPNTVEGLSNTLSNLNDETMQKAESSMTTQECKLWLPKFKITSTFDLINDLKAIGIKAIFDAATANCLTGILEEEIPLYISLVIQKAFVEVNEEGAEAAAATGVGAGSAAGVFPPPEIPEINCDHPFLFLIYYGGQVMFAGKYENNK